MNAAPNPSSPPQPAAPNGANATAAVNATAARGRAVGLQQAFDAWLGDQQRLARLRHASSQAVYRAMWQALVAWCGRQRPAVGLRSLDAATLARYLASRAGQAGLHEPLNPRYQWRLLSLVQRVQAHHSLRHQLAPHTAAADLIATRPAVRRANASLVDELPAHLRPDEARRLVLALNRPPEPTPPRWQDLRNRCAAALQLGAGLGPGELRALRVDDVRLHAGQQPPRPWQLDVPANGSARAHAVPVQGWAARLLGDWLQRRADEQLGGAWLFPSTRSGKPWGKVAQFESVRRLLADAGIDEAGGGSFRLRHTFALRQLQRGRAPDEVARWLGIADPAVMARYQRVLAGTPPR